MSLFSRGGDAPAHGRRSKIGRFVLMAGLVSSILGAVSFSTGHAEAALAACRSDPVIVVNGAIADVFSTLWTQSSNIRELDYVVTVPSGSLIGKLTLTAGIGFPEKVTYVFSPAQPWGTIRIDATVQTWGQVAPFQTSVQATTLLGGVQTAYGSSAGTVSLTVGRQLML